jgi:phospholipid/cholesterol/gamma-HCH transport system ATP-binding protein
MVKRAGLARAMILEPQILLCDEPLSGLDPVTGRLIERLLVEVNRRRRITMIVTSHHVHSTTRMADHVVFLVDGGALCGSPAELARSADPRISAFLEAASSDPDAGRPAGAPSS